MPGYFPEIEWPQLFLPSNGYFGIVIARLIRVINDSVAKVPLRRLGFALIAMYGYKSKKINNILCIKNLRKGKSD